MKLGIILEGKTPPDKRVGLTPDQCKTIVEQYNEIKIFVQKSAIRCFSDQQYTDAGLELVDSVDFCDVIVGVKEVPLDMLSKEKTHVFFSHTAKKQPYNRRLLQEILKQNINLIDYEYITNDDGRRLIGFGRYAGIVGAYNGFLTFGKKHELFNLKPAFQCEDRKEIERELDQIHLGAIKIVLTGSGRVSRGAREILEHLNVKEVTPNEFMTQNFDDPVFTNPLIKDLYQRKDGKLFETEDFYANPSDFTCKLKQYCTQADMLITGHSWSNGFPVLLGKEDFKEDFKPKVVADITCDIDEPIACTKRPTVIGDPYFHYDPTSESEISQPKEDSIWVMAVDNLPCELPKDASEDFGAEFMKHVVPELLNHQSKMIDRATIAKRGALNTPFEYLKDYVRH